MDTYEWSYTLDPTPIQNALAAEAANLTANWTQVYESLNVSAVFTWESGGWNEFNAKLGLNLTAGLKYYGLVRAHNGAGLVSPVMSSGGVLVGKSQVYPSQKEQTVMGFNTQKATDGNVNTSDTHETTGALVVPPGAVAQNDTSLVAGVLGSGEAGKGGVVDPSNTTAPANNFKFGDYSFSENMCCHGH